MKNLTTKLAATLFILSGCAQNELIDSPNQGTPNDGKVRFSATSALTGTRAADDNPFNTTAGLQKLGKFTVDGFLNGESIYGLGAQTVEWKNGSWEYTNEPYWPSGDAKIDFFAYANWEKSGATVVIAEDGITATPTNTNITIGEDVLGTTGQHDFLVAATLGATKQSRTLITFKHALTQIVFKAGNIDADKLDVRIGGVRIVNVNSKATQMEYKGATPAITWSLSADKADAKYHVQGLQVAATADWNDNVEVGNDVYDVPTTTKSLGDYSDYKVIQKTSTTKNNALLLLPQSFNAWNPNDIDGTKDDSYIELLAVVKDPTKASSDILTAATDQNKVDALKPYYYCGLPNYNAGGNTESYGIIRIPVSSLTGEIGEWKAGKRITYLITFGDKGSGSGGGGYTPGGDPVLVPIRFNAIVEDWVDVNVPLLTATFEATSGTVDGAFIDGYTKQLMNDIKAARVPKVYKSTIKIKGQLSQTSTNQTIITTDLINNNTLVGSTVTYDFTGIDQWGKTLAITAPTGWEAKFYKGDLNTEITVDPKLDGTSANIVVLTKTSENTTTYTTTAPEYISDFFTAIRINEKNNAVRAAGWTINVSGKIDTKEVAFSADDLTILSATTANTEITVSLTSITFANGGTLSVTVPAGWKATCGSSTTKFVGEKLTASSNTDPIKFIKL